MTRGKRHPAGAPHRRAQVIAAHKAIGFSLFDPLIGACDIAWGEHALVGAKLPETDEARIRARMQLARFPREDELAPLPDVRAAVNSIGALLRSERDDLRDMSGVPPFERCVYECVRGIAPSTMLAYGEVAVLRSRAGAWREPFRADRAVLSRARGRSGGFSAQVGVTTKLRAPQIEGARIEAEPELIDA